MKTHSCPLCSQNSELKLIYQGSHSLFKCGSCSLIFSDRIFDPKFFDFYTGNEEDFYDRPYFDDQGPNPDDPNYQEALKRARKKLGEKDNRLLDIGCGSGALMRMAYRIGFQPEGLEVSSTVSARIRNDFPIHLYDGRHAHFPDLPPYDAVALWDVLEHLPEPVGALRSLRRYLKPSGVLILRTLNEDCLLSVISMVLYKISGGFFRAAAERMHEKYHVIYFTKSTLAATLEKAGFKVEDHWLGEFPATRASSSKIVQVGLNMVYIVQRLFRRTYEQCVLASPVG